VPVAIVYRRSLFRRDGSAPLLQYGYGAYGISSDPLFSSSLLSLLDRGFVYAIAQVREARNVAAAGTKRVGCSRKTFVRGFHRRDQAPRRCGLRGRERVFARAASAGGLLVAAAANMAPELYRGIVAHVPFVDIVTAMLDREASR